MAMEQNKRIGGVCGFMQLQLERMTDEMGHYTDGYNP